MADLSKKRAKFLPMPGRLAVEPIEEERYGGLILPPSKEKATLGTILHLGCNAPCIKLVQDVGYDDVKEDSIFLYIGDVVLFGANSGMAVEVGLGANRRKAIFLRESEIISKVEWEEIEEDLTTETLSVNSWVCQGCGFNGQVIIRSNDILECPRCAHRFRP